MTRSELIDKFTFEDSGVLVNLIEAPKSKHDECNAVVIPDN